MQHTRSAALPKRFRIPVLMSAILAASMVSAGRPVAADEQRPYTVEVHDVTAKVGEHAVMRVTLRPWKDYRILEAYNNRLGQFSSFDDGVAFERKTVRGTIQNGALVFTIDVQPTKPGKHPINGVFRVGYIENEDAMSMISVPLIASVIGSD
jgi:hypothetical protein